jgi:manganese-dependent inorganic pyrophosphatase
LDDIIYVMGHRNPDTDSICSAIAYADLKKRSGVNAVPVRIGEINRETEYVLNNFKTPVPVHLETLKLQVSDLQMDKAVSISSDFSVKTAWNLMQKNNAKTLPVVDDGGRLIGIATLSDITKKNMDMIDTNLLGISDTSLQNIVETINARLFLGNPTDFAPSGKILVAAMTPDRMVQWVEKNDIVIVGNRIENQIQALELGANVVVITGGSAEETPELKQKTADYRSIVLVTPFDTFTTSRLITQSIPIKYVMTTKNIVAFNTDDFLDDIQEAMQKTRYRSYPVVDDENRVQGIVARYHLISQRKKKVILVDHNERSQSINTIDEADILEIIDHHRVGDIQTGKPIFFKNEPLGSTATIIANLFFENGLRPSRSIAGLLCSAILSDTLKFQSPTSTYIDRMMVERLAELAGIKNVDEYAMAMFQAGSVLVGKTPEEIFTKDFKVYELGKYKIGISQINVFGSEFTEDMKKEFLSFMEYHSERYDYDLLILMLTDMIKEGTELLFTGKSKELIPIAFGMQPKDSSLILPGTLSRKKQVVPLLSTAAQS